MRRNIIRAKLNTPKIIKQNRVKRREIKMEMNITEITNNFDMSTVLKQRLEEARRKKWLPAVIEENGHLIFRKTNSGRKSMGESYLEEKNGYVDEE